MKIFIGSDHNGFELKHQLVSELKSRGYDVIDTGDEKLNPEDDYPVFAHKMVTAMLSSDEKNPMGILLCGSGQGMCMAANRFRGIRAALIYNKQSAHDSRNDDDANVACLPARNLNASEAFTLVDTWLKTPFANAPRFKRRINEMDEMG